MVRKIIALILLILCVFLMSCSSSKDISNDTKDLLKLDTLAIVGKDVILLKEYEDFYIKNNGGKEAVDRATDESKEQFLDLLVKYKLKVKEAVDLGYQNESDVKKEIEEYKRSLAIPFIIEREVTEPSLKLWYERRKKNLKIAAILMRVNWNNPQDTLEKYNRAVKIIDSLKNGINFASLAFRHSDLKQTLPDSGVLGYISAAQTVKNFEDPLYTLSIGEVYPVPIHVPAGYIIPKLLDVEPRTGGRKFAHILFQFSKGTKEDSLAVMQKAEEVLERLKKGDSFEKLAEQLSDDVDTRSKGGVIGTFERHPGLNNPPEFFKAAFALKEKEFSGLVKTFMGIHIIKYISAEPYPAYDKAKEELKEDYKSLKYEGDYQQFISLNKAKAKFTIDLDIVNQFYSKLDTNKNTSSPNWDSLLTKEFRTQTVFTIGEQKKSVDEVIELMKNHPDFRALGFTPSGFKNIIDKAGEVMVMNYRADDVDRLYPDFKDVMKEYIDGLLLFRAEQNFVWNKISISDTALREYYANNKEDFQFPDRVDISEIFVPNDSIAKVIYKQLTDSSDISKTGGKGKKSKSKKVVVKPTFEEMAAKYTTREGYKEKKGHWGLLAESDNQLAKAGMALNTGAISEPFAFENGYSIIKVNSKEPPRVKKYEECGPELSSRFQEYETKRLEKIWVDNLKIKFPVTLFKDKLKTAFSNYKK